MSSPPFKRQRTSSSVLTAPFKSPVPRKGGASLSSPARSTTPSTSTSTSTLPPSTGLTTATEDPSASGISHSSSTLHTPRPKIQAKPLPRRSPASILGDPELKTLQTHVTALTRQLHTVREALDTATQAERLERSPRDAELGILITRWTSAARSAAEELLAVAKEKVNSAGGLQAYRQREIDRLPRQKEGWENDDAEEGRREGGEEVEGTREEYDEYSVERETERGEMDQTLPWMKGDEQTFTMGMLLLSLGIELQAIGFDAAEQKWVD